MTEEEQQEDKNKHIRPRERARGQKLLLQVEQMHKMTIIFTQTDNFDHLE